MQEKPVYFLVEFHQLWNSDCQCCCCMTTFVSDQHWASAWQNQQNDLCAPQRQISLGIRPLWSEPLLCALWVAKDAMLLQADSEDSDQTGQMPRLIWVFTRHTSFCWFCHALAQLSFIQFLWKLQYIPQSSRLTAENLCIKSSTSSSSEEISGPRYDPAFIQYWIRLEKKKQQHNWAMSRDYGTFCPL